MVNYKDFKLYIFCFVSITYLYITNNNLSLNDLIYSANQTDIISYYAVAEIAPSLPKDTELQKHVVQRFLTAYFVGSFSKFLNLDIFISYKLFVVFFLILYSYVSIKCTKILKLDFCHSLLFLSLVFFNPYTIRWIIFNPIMLGDLIFFCSCFLFPIYLLRDKHNKYILISIFATFLRQTSIALFIGSTINLLTKRKYSKLFIYIFLYILFFILIVKLSDHMTNRTFPMFVAYKIFFFDYSKWKELISFIFLPIISFFPYIIITFFANINKDLDKNKILILSVIVMMMIGQPILGGPDGSDRNVVRIASLCIPILTFLTFYTFNFKKLLDKKIFFCFSLICFWIWSLHPTFSSTNFFSVLRF